MTPNLTNDEREAVELARAWSKLSGTDAEAPIYRALDDGDTKQIYGIDEMAGAYALGFLAARRAEGERSASLAAGLGSAIKALRSVGDLIRHIEADTQRDNNKLDDAINTVNAATSVLDALLSKDGAQ